MPYISHIIYFFDIIINLLFFITPNKAADIQIKFTSCHLTLKNEHIIISSRHKQTA